MDKSPDAQAKGETSKKPLATRGVKNGSPAQSPRRATNAPRPTTLRTPGAVPRASSTKSTGIKDALATKSSTCRTVASSPKKSSVSTDGDMSSPMKNPSTKLGQGGDKKLQEKAASPNKSVERPQASAARLGQGGETSLPNPGNGTASKTEVKTQLRDKAQRPRPERTASLPSKSSIASPDSAKPTKVSPVKRVQTLPSSPKPVNAATMSAKPVKTASAPAKPDSPSLTTKSTATALVKSSKSAPLQTKPTKSPSATVKPVNHAAGLAAKSARVTSAPVKPVNTASVPRQPEKNPLTSVKSASVPTKPEKIPSTPVKPASVPSKAEKNQSPLAKPGNKVSLPSKPPHTGSKLNKTMKNAPVPAKQVTTTPVPVKPRNGMESPSKTVIGQSPLSISADKEEEREVVPQSPVKPVTHPDETVINKQEIKKSINEEKISEAVSMCVAPVIWAEQQLVESTVNESKDLVHSVNSNLESVEEAANTMIPPMEGELREPSTNQAPVDQPMEEPLETSKMVVKLPLEAVKCALKSHNSSSIEQPPIASPNTAIESMKDLQCKSAEQIELQNENLSCLHELTDKCSGNAEDIRRGNVEHTTKVTELAEPQVPSVAAGNITEQVMFSAETVTALLEDEVHSVDQIKALDECLRFTVDSGNKFEEESSTSCTVEPTKLAGKSPESGVEPVNNLEGFVTSPPKSASTETTGYLVEETTLRVDPFTYQEESATGEIIQKEVSQLGGKLQFQVEEDILFQVEPVNLTLMEGEGLLEDVAGFPVEQGSHSVDEALPLLGPMEHLSSEMGLQVVEKLNNLEEDVKYNGQSQILMEGLMSIDKTMESEENDVILSEEDGETEHSLAESKTSTEDGEPAIVISTNVVELEAVTFLVEGVSTQELQKSRADIENRPETELHLNEGVFSEEPDNSKAKLENEAETESETSLEEDHKSMVGMEYKVEIEPGTSLEEDVSTVKPNQSTESLESLVEMEPVASLEDSASLGETDLCADENTTKTGPINAVDGASLTENDEFNRAQMEPIVSSSASHIELEQVPFFEESVSSLEIKPSAPSLKEGATSVEIKLDSSLEEGVNSLETELEKTCEALSSTKPDESIEETEHVVDMEPVTFAFQRISSPMEPEGSQAEAAIAFSKIAITALPQVQKLKEPEKEQINTSELENKPAKLVTIPVFPEITGEPALETVEPLEEPVIHHAEQLLASVEPMNSIMDPVHSLSEQKCLKLDPMNNVTEQITATEEVEAEESVKEENSQMDYPVNTLTSQGVSITPSVYSVAEEPMITLVEPSNYTEETQVESGHFHTSLVDTGLIELTKPKYFPEMPDIRMDSSSSQGGVKSPMTGEHKNLPFDPVAVPSSETVTQAVEPTVSSTVPATTTIDISSSSQGLSCSELEGPLQVMAPEPPSEGDNAQPGELKNVVKCLSMDPRGTTEQGVGEPWVLVQREELDDYKEEELEEKLKRPVTLNQESEEEEDDEEKGKGDDEEGEAVASRCSTLSDPQLAGQSSSETSTPEELRTYEDSSSGVESHSDDVATSPPTTLTPDPDLGIHMGQEEGGETPAGTPASKGKGTLNLLRDADNGGLSQGQAPAGVLDHSESGSEGYKREMPGINCSQDSTGARGQEQEEKAGAGGIQRGYSLAQPCDGLYTIYESERGHQERGPRGSELGLVEQIIGRTLLLAASEGGGRGVVRGVELGRWAELLSPLDESRASITSVTSFSPEGDTSPQGDWTVVEVETFH
uniref:BTB/POZ domain-containing protein n=1 Tax=Leptobrachium leishanense TaxID=445787 RepID=A0A8C5WFY5_9ANUR